MKIHDIVNLRLQNQQLVRPAYISVKDIVSFMGAMQAQDLMMSLWGVGIRLPGSSERDIISAFNKGEILRTHVIRPTWHLVSPDDIDWMIDLSGPRIKSGIKTRWNELGLTSSILEKSFKLIEALVTENEFCTREELIKEISTAKIKTGENRASHIFAAAGLEKIICSGKLVKNKQTYALYSNRIKKKPKNISREEALCLLASRYFASRSPATLNDFINWSNLSKTEAKQALGGLGGEFTVKEIEGAEYIFNNKDLMPDPKSVHLIPAFDEYIIAYKDRSAVIHNDYIHRAVLKNGMFTPAVLVSGEVKGIWKRKFHKDCVIIEVTMFERCGKKIKSAIEAEASYFGSFLGKEMSITFKEG